MKAIREKAAQVKTGKEKMMEVPFGKENKEPARGIGFTEMRKKGCKKGMK